MMKDFDTAPMDMCKYIVGIGLSVNLSTRRIFNNAMHPHVPIYKHTCIHILIHTCVQTSIHTCMRPLRVTIHAYIHNIHMYARPYIHAPMHIETCIFAYLLAFYTQTCKPTSRLHYVRFTNPTTAT